MFWTNELYCLVARILMILQSCAFWPVSVYFSGSPAQSKTVSDLYFSLKMDEYAQFEKNETVISDVHRKFCIVDRLESWWTITDVSSGNSNTIVDMRNVFLHYLWGHFVGTTTPLGYMCDVYNVNRNSFQDLYQNMADFIKYLKGTFEESRLWQTSTTSFRLQDFRDVLIRT